VNALSDRNGKFYVKDPNGRTVPNPDGRRS
jgi:hypothetical protein